MLARVGWMFAGTLAGNLARFVFGLILARQLGAAEFGRFNLCTLFTLSVYTILGIGLCDTAVRYVAIAITRRSRQQLLRTLRFIAFVGALLGVLGGALLLATTDYIASVWFQKPELAVHLRALAWTIPIGVVFLCGTGIIHAFEAFRALNLIRNVAFPSLPLVLWLIVGRSGDIDDAVLSWNVGLAISAVAALICSSVLCVRASVGDEAPTSSRRDEVGYAASSSLVGLLNVLQSWLETFFLGRLSNAVAVGRYGAATRLVQPITFATFSFISVYNPRAASLHAVSARSDLKQLHHDTTRWTIITTALPYIGLLTFGEPLLRLFGDDFTAAWSALALYASAQMILSITGPSAQLLMMTGHQNRVVLSMILGVGGSALSGWVLIPPWGVAGAGAAFLVSMAVYALSSMLQVRRIHGYWPWERRSALVALTVLVGACAGVVLHMLLPLVPMIPAGAALLAVTALWLHRLGLTDEERRRLRAKLVRSAS
jgi:O-antigen/teichoic acid export membrane protein